MLSGMTAGVGAVITSVVYDMGKTVVKEKDPVNLILMLCSFIAAFFFQINIIYIILMAAVFGAVRTCLAGKRGKIQ
jgi:chromate transporter